MHLMHKRFRVVVFHSQKKNWEKKKYFFHFKNANADITESFFLYSQKIDREEEEDEIIAKMCREIKWKSTTFFHVFLFDKNYIMKTFYNSILPL